MVKYERKLSLVIILFFLGMSISPVITGVTKNNNSSEKIEFVKDFSKPVLIENEDFIDILIEDSNSHLTNDGLPMIPIFTKSFEFPFGTEITNIEATVSSSDMIKIEKPVKPVPTKQKIGKSIIFKEGLKNKEAYSSYEYYPSYWIDYKTGVGLSKNNNHVLLLSLQIFPVSYSPLENIIKYISHIKVSI